MEEQNQVQKAVEQQLGNLVLQVITKDAVIAQLSQKLTELEAALHPAQKDPKE